ncbi:glycoside hydrolase family 3 N-terminal domain-containing protein [Halorhabdus amylolytica]|uniref:glycoside hydrolase family 3 N-terminal domain-containing protein n=1 Tax=Halorhabdus amylolytica TaxID=2559573 RepID=UPI0010A9B0C3|nr:glycoside hydrolase family 3 N-terminal domain-containing protein [Halorhabdus amylolytica]
MTGTGKSALGTYVDEQRRETIADRVEELLSEMTVEEKVGQLNQRSVSFVMGPEDGNEDLEAAIADGEIGSVLNAEGLEAKQHLQEFAVEESRLGIPLLMAFDVIHGYRTVFPTPLGQAATWEPDLAERAERVAATEASADGHHWTFAPMVDVSRDPRWGRVMEGAGESPVLGSAFARARVRGFQGEDLTEADTMLACAKHFAGYGASEAGRDYNTVNVAETALRERHLPPFEAAVEEGVATVMNAFNTIERIPASGNEDLVSGVLKGEWDFAGAMVSDWNSFGEQLPHGVAADEREAAKLAMLAGSDIDMVSEVLLEELPDLVRDGDVPESRLDDAVERVLWVKGLAGLFEDPYRYFEEERRKAVTLTEDHRETAREVAERSFVLLKNEGVLPLTEDTEVGLVGALADSAEDTLGAWAWGGEPEDVTTIRAGLDDHFGDVPYAPGYDLPGEVTAESLDEARDIAEEADVVVAVVGEPADMVGEAASRAHIDLPGDQRRLLEAVHETETPVVALLMNGRPLAVEWLDDHLPAILDVWHPGTEAGPAIARTLTGEVVPSGHLPMSFPYTEGQIPVAHDRLPTGRPAEDSEEDYVSKYLDVPNDPLYAFGHGESYTDFAFTDLTLASDAFPSGKALEATVTIENTGDVAGRDVVQLYVQDLVGSRSRPEKELVAFETVELEPDETAEVTVEIDEDDLAFWTDDEKWAAEPGEFDLMVGHAADDIVHTERFTLVE